MTGRARHLSPARYPGAPGYRACDDPDLICQGTIYVIPVWEIDPGTGMVILYEAEPATGQLVPGPGGRFRPVAQVPAPNHARPDARPRVVWDYAGQTIRDLRVRDGEHDEDQCWADVKAGPAMILEQGQWDKRTRDSKEIQTILTLRPRFNHEHNQRNPDRIPLDRQLELRHARDRALGRPFWQPLDRIPAEPVVMAGLAGPEPRYPAQLAAAMLTGLVRWVRSWRPLARAALLVVAAWCAATMLGAAALSRWGWPPDRAAIVSAVVNLGVGAAVSGKGRRRRRLRRKR